MEISTIIDTITACEDYLADYLKKKKQNRFFVYWFDKLPEIKKSLQDSIKTHPDRALTCRRCIHRINEILKVTKPWCKFKVPGNVYCFKPVVGKSLGIDACKDCIQMTKDVFQKIGELGIPIRTADGGKMPHEIAINVEKGKVRRAKNEIQRPKINN